jgi:insulysin
MGPQDYVFNEVNDLGKINFDFAEKGRPMGTVTNVAKRMQIFDDSNISEIFRCAYIRKTFDKEFNKKISEVLTDPTQTLIFLQSKSFEGTTDSNADWYDTKYSVEKYSDELL